ncbi:DUF724 domain-containing protein 9 [Arabidopsis thaliana]|uniref:Agenet-like domain n=1 Tax=Arabidopsis thaliana x Arabidopsis arenosa TaxID=1240361 RepID=A0A8T2CYR6_9BRAS|nr:Agenet-like domain [Arabidopsis thaliana x Arabidopsis arenosa]
MNKSKFLWRLAKAPMFSPGTTVEVSSKINNKEVVWVPAVVIKEFKEDDEYKYIVRVYDKSFSCKGNEAARLNKTVDLCSLRPTPPSISVEEYQLKEYVEVFHDGMGWRQGRVMKIQERVMLSQGRVMVSQGRVMGNLSQKCYIVLLEATKKQISFKQSDLRPLQVWEDGVWKTRESSLTQGSGDETSDSVRNANESDPPVTPRPGITTPPLKQIEAETQRKTLPRNQNASVNDSTRENENSEDINRKRKREESLCSDASVEDTTMTLPFEKKLSIWKTLESVETVPQSPHFSPLVETREDCREMSAVGMMLTFPCLLEEVKSLQHDNSISSLISLSNNFCELEKHGFNVKAPQSRISKLLSLRGKQSMKMDELKGAEKVTAEKESIKIENERKILELQRLNEEVDKEIAQSKSCAAKIVQQLEDVELQFQTTASAPW